MDQKNNCQSCRNKEIIIDYLCGMRIENIFSKHQINEKHLAKLILLYLKNDIRKLFSHVEILINTATFMPGNMYHIRASRLENLKKLFEDTFIDG